VSGKFRQFLAQCEEHLAGLLLAAVTLLIGAQLVLTSAAPAWASPLTTLILALFFWATLLGVPAATRRRAHISIVLLRRHLPARWHVGLQAAWLAAALAFFGLLAVTGTGLCLDLLRWGNSYLGTWCPEWAVTAAVPVAAALSCVRAVQAWRVSDEAGQEV